MTSAPDLLQLLVAGFCLLVVATAARRRRPAMDRSAPEPTNASPSAPSR